MRAFIVAAVLTLASFASARAGPADDCSQDKDQDLRIRGCTSIIEGSATGSKPAAYNARGSAYYDKGDYDSAIADLSEAIRLDPKDANAYYHRGLAFAGIGNAAVERAIADFIQLDPKSVGAYYNRGNAYNNKGDYKRAIADYDAALRLDPTLKDAAKYRQFALAQLAKRSPAR